jgi:hypothetical protein
VCSIMRAIKQIILNSIVYVQQCRLSVTLLQTDAKHCIAKRTSQQNCGIQGTNTHETTLVVGLGEYVLARFRIFHLSFCRLQICALSIFHLRTSYGASEIPPPGGSQRGA